MPSFLRPAAFLSSPYSLMGSMILPLVPSTVNRVEISTSVPFGGLEILRSAFDKVTEQMAQLPEGKLVVGKGQLDSFLGPGTDDSVVEV